MTADRPRVLIVSENVSMRMGGESSLPFYYAKLLEARGAEVWIACHERVADELREAFAPSWARVRLVPDTPLQKFLHRSGALLPYRVRDLIVGQAIHIITQRRIRRIARGLAREGLIDVVLEPSPITPKGPSFMYGLGVPVVIGPLCGGINFPPAFRDMDSRATRLAVALGRRASDLINRLAPGKRRADLLLVANDQAAAALPAGCRGRVVHLVESGVDLSIWDAGTPTEGPPARPAGPVRFVFSGRFVDWKGVDYLARAFARVAASDDGARLDLIGGGELEGAIRAAVEVPSLRDRVRLHGWLSRPEAARVVREADVFVMPSLRECGGTAILEAMALGKPVVATDWAGPSHYVDSTCGILVAPSSKEAFVDGLADAMTRLAASPELRARLGDGGRARVRQEYFDWDSKADRMLEILTEVVRERR